MTTARELVRVATAAGAKLAVRGDRLSVRAPRPLAPELVAELRLSKTEILRLLAAEPGDDFGSPLMQPGGAVTS
jgi:TubC N-terminal docking domain